MDRHFLGFLNLMSTNYIRILSRGWLVLFFFKVHTENPESRFFETGSQGWGRGPTRSVDRSSPDCCIKCSKMFPQNCDCFIAKLLLRTSIRGMFIIFYQRRVYSFKGYVFSVQDTSYARDVMKRGEGRERERERDAIPCSRCDIRQNSGSAFPLHSIHHCTQRTHELQQNAYVIQTRDAQERSTTIKKKKKKKEIHDI